MKFIFFTLSFFFCSLLASAQTLSENKAAPQLADGGQYVFKNETCLPPAERNQIIKRLDTNRAELLRQGLLKEDPSRVLVLFEWPVVNAPALDYNGCWAISNFVDQDLTSGIKDYECGTRSYDGHKGTDIFTWPFTWHLKDNDLVYAVAAADGIILGKDDGEEDNHCSCFGTWNAVYIEHADGSIAWYGHLKSGSLTSKNIGESVTTGEYLGVIASSGCSTGPHLHFEVYKDLPYNQANLIDPFAGPCNDQNNESWWTDQLDYREPKINAALTHGMAPVLGCPSNNEFPNFKNLFLPSETIYTAFYFKDQLSGTTASFELRRPNGTLYTSWTKNFIDTYDASYWYYTWTLPSDGPFGTWTLSADYNGESIAHPFQYLEVLPPVAGVGINTSNPKSELHLHDSAIFIDNAEKGIIMKGENGSCYLIKVNSSGTLVAELLAECPN